MLIQLRVRINKSFSNEQTHTQRTDYLTILLKLPTLFKIQTGFLILQINICFYKQNIHTFSKTFFKFFTKCVISPITFKPIIFKPHSTTEKR